MLDEYQKIKGYKSPATFTGKPISMEEAWVELKQLEEGGCFVLLFLTC